MWQVLTESIQLANLPFTALLGAVVVYWLMVAVGFLSFESAADAHADVSVDGHMGDGHLGDAQDAAGGHGHGAADGDVGGADHHHVGFLSHVAHFLNIGEVPVMIVVSVLSLWLWLFSMIANHYFNQGSFVRAAVLVVPNVALSLVLTRALTWPLKKFFVALNRDYDGHKPLLGRTCTMMTGEVTRDFGQAQIKTGGAPLLIHVRTTDGELLRKGETGLVVREDKRNNIYYVVKVTADKLEG